MKNSVYPTKYQDKLLEERLGALQCFCYLNFLKLSLLISHSYYHYNSLRFRLLSQILITDKTWSFCKEDRSFLHNRIVSSKQYFQRPPSLPKCHLEIWCRFTNAFREIRPWCLSSSAGCNLCPNFCPSTSTRCPMIFLSASLLFLQAAPHFFKSKCRHLPSPSMFYKTS